MVIVTAAVNGTTLTTTVQSPDSTHAEVTVAYDGRVQTRQTKTGLRVFLRLRCPRPADW